MAFKKKTWEDRLSEFPGRRLLKIITRSSNNSEITVDVSRNEGVVSRSGDTFSAENMNDLEQRIEEEFNEINGNLSHMFEVIKCTEAIINNVVPQGAFYSVDTVVTYILPSGYTPVMAVAYSPNWFAQVTLMGFNDNIVKMSIYNSYTTAQDITIGAYVLVEKKV